MKLSLGSWAFSFGPYSEHPVPLEDAARRAAQAGYDGLEVSGFPPHAPLESYPTAASRAELRRFLGGLGLAVSAYSADFTLINPSTAGNEQRYLDLFRRNLDMCVELEAPGMRLDTVSAPGSIPDAQYEAAFDRLAALWHDAAELAAKAGVRILWEFEPGNAFNKPSEVVDLYEKVGHPNFSVLFDTSHAYMCGVVGARQHGTPETLAGGVEQFLDILSGRIGHIHIIDSDGTLYGEETSTHVPFGDGLIDFAKLGPKLRATPGIDWWCIDLCFWPRAWDLVEPSLAFVRKLLR